MEMASLIIVKLRNLESVVLGFYNYFGIQWVVIDEAG